MQEFIVSRSDTHIYKLVVPLESGRWGFLSRSRSIHRNKYEDEYYTVSGYWKTAHNLLPEDAFMKVSPDAKEIKLIISTSMINEE